jgi:hypothetical protein
MGIMSHISPFIVGACFYESMIILVDTIKTPRQKEMQPWEFLVFICRMTYEHYKNTPYKDEMMYIKLEKMLPAWLAPVY